MIRLLALLSLLSIITSCDGGLDPTGIPKSAFIRGTIHYTRGAGKSNFPPTDSLLDLRVVAFKEIPRDTNVLLTVLTANAFFTTSLLDSSYVATKEYTIEIPHGQLVADTALVVRYIAVAQQYGANISSDWRVIGLYSVKGDTVPSPLNLVSAQIKSDVNINVDFKKIPPQPFKR